MLPTYLGLLNYLGFHSNIMCNLRKVIPLDISFLIYIDKKMESTYRFTVDIQYAIAVLGKQQLLNRGWLYFLFCGTVP